MNKNWKIAFCGTGSIGTRHLKNLIEIFTIRAENYTIDCIRNNTGKLPPLFSDVVSNVYSYEDQIEKDYDIIFVTNPTSIHYETIRKYQWHTKSMFIEKPIFDNYQMHLDNVNNKCIFYVACPVRYKKVIQYIKSNVNPHDVLSAIAICSSYLPDWRKGTDYRKNYSAIKELGGGVSLDLIHELDYLSYLFGLPKQIHNIRGHVSPLQINSDDISTYIAELDNVIIQVYLDYFGRKDIRTLTLFTIQDTIQVDLLSNNIEYMVSGEKISFVETRDDFQKQELLYFLDVIEGKAENTNDIKHACQLLKNTFGEV